ncbi:MAG: hypothetical protein CL910_22205 [Deltaproteobacteria bacterium]|jgi:hypothetical protein|nr:hypothetical protein [Deltaproteobacteria bacterium]
MARILLASGLALTLLLGAGGARAEKPVVVFIAGGPSHRYGAHEFGPGSALLAEALNGPGSPVRARVHRGGWPRDVDPLADAAAVVLYLDGGTGHAALPHLALLESHAARGLGVVALHYAVELPAGPPSEAFRRWIGGTYESGFSTNPMWTAQLALDPAHPITRGVRPFRAYDEWYFNLRFAEDGVVTPIATAVPDDEARADPTWPPFANDAVLLASGRTETLVFARERPGGGRGVGFTGGHFHWNWGHDDFRTLVLNAIAWAAGAEVPAAGVPSLRPSYEELAEGQDERQPWFFFDEEETIERFGLRRRATEPPTPSPPPRRRPPAP